MIAEEVFICERCYFKILCERCVCVGGLGNRGEIRFVGWGVMEVRVRRLNGRNTEVGV